jgi:hypothetical protein
MKEYEAVMAWWQGKTNKPEKNNPIIFLSFTYIMWTGL